MSTVAVASSSQLSAQAGARIGELGGNAVDAAIAASLVSMTTEPGVCSLGGGGFVTLWAPDQAPVTIDGSIAMPGTGLPQEALGQGAFAVNMAYGGDLTTLVGHGSIGTPGALAALGAASERAGKLPWSELVQPAYELARDGFPMPQPSHEYLRYSHNCVYGWQALSHAALHDENGELIDVGALVRVADLDISLAQLARHGPQDFYRGDIAQMIAQDSQANGGVLTLADLQQYTPTLRAPVQMKLGPWTLATNPPPAVGGTTLSAMLELMARRPPCSSARWQCADVEYLIRVQETVLGFRRGHLDLSDTLEQDANALLQRCRSGELDHALTAPSTVHTSAVDQQGLACSITMSSGYGAGVIPPGTGIWMNNCLGEIELNRRGLIAGPPGTRLNSNMAPTVARADHAVMAIGSPGADRITSALVQTLTNLMLLEMPLQEAVDHPRLHTELLEDGIRVAYEAGMPVDRVAVRARRFEEPSMYFGGVGAALVHRDQRFEIAADPRRTGGAAMGHCADARQRDQ